MKSLFKTLGILLLTLLIALMLAAGIGYWHALGKLPERDGTLHLHGLKAPVQVRWDERGVPHITAQNEADLYRALGFLHAQDRLFQMELMRRLAKGELAEIFGPRLLETDRLFRTLGLRAQAEAKANAYDYRQPAGQALLAYLEGINEFQDTRPLPLEYEVLGIRPLPFTPADTFAVTGYLAYSFAATLRTEPVMSYVRDHLGPGYLRAFDIDWNPLGVLSPQARLLSENADDAKVLTKTALKDADWNTLARVAEASQQAADLIGVPFLEGSNAWAIAGSRTASGKPLLAGDPHIDFSVPAVWWEAQLTAPGFDLYGHFMALSPYALLGFNTQFGWSLTMFQNDDMDLIALPVNPANPNQVWDQASRQWATPTTRNEVIEVKGEDPDVLTVKLTPQGPLINEAFSDTLGTTIPMALWWTFLQTDNPVLEAFYDLNRANTLAKARYAASRIAAPGLNIVWANAAGDIGWWAAAKLVQRPLGVNPTFILDGGTSQVDKPGYYRFADNPQEENPERGYVVSANHQPLPKSGVPVYGYYNNPARARRLDDVLNAKSKGWTVADSQTLQLDEQNDYAPRLIKTLLPLLQQAINDSTEHQTEQTVLLNLLKEWNGRYDSSSIAATVFTQFVYELAKGAMADELGPRFFKALLRTRVLEPALLRLAADDSSPWWDDRDTTDHVETRGEIVTYAWREALTHLVDLHGKVIGRWNWNENHTLTHKHALGQVWPLNLLFNVGPFGVPGGREVPNNLNAPLGNAPWAVEYGPSTRRVIDFARPGEAQGINPVGESGVLFDEHYDDQADAYALGRSYTMHLDPVDVRKSTRSILTLQPDE